jgi:putative hydrolase of the HAD superfamily
MTRALIFDLDDTLYRERRFALSGYAEVARMAERVYRVPAADAFHVLQASLRTGSRAQAFQRLASLLGTGEGGIEAFREAYRRHMPRLRLSGPARAALATARRHWRVGILTNGPPAVQRAKVEALGLTELVDRVVYAHEVGAGKPDAQVFVIACRLLGVSPEDAVMAGDDPWCDVDGARGAGLMAIRVRQGWHRAVESGLTGPADATVETIADVPAAAERLIHERALHAD